MSIKYNYWPESSVVTEDYKYLIERLGQKSIYIKKIYLSENRFVMAPELKQEEFEGEWEFYV